MLADHDGVIDDDADHHDQGEQADHVDRLASRQHHGEGRHHRDRNADRNPQRDATIEKEKQHADHQHQAAQAVAQQQVYALLDQVRLEVELLHAQARWQGGRKLGHGGIDDAGDLQGIFADGALNVQLDGGHAVEQRDGSPLLDRITNGGDIAEQDLLATARGANLDVAKGSRIAAAADTAYLQLCGATGIARGQILAARLHRPRHIRQGEVELQQGSLIYLDPDFAVARTE